MHDQDQARPSEHRFTHKTSNPPIKMTRLKALLESLPPIDVAEPLRDFKLFGRLPLELRRLIWAVAVSQPRRVKLFTPMLYWVVDEWDS